MTTALLVVDVQNDFCEGGSLAVAGGSKVAADITQLVMNGPEYPLYVLSRDWHMNPGEHFASNIPGAEPDYLDTWPDHCVAGTEGANFHKWLDLPHYLCARMPRRDVHLISKGMHSAAYSAFEGIELDYDDRDLQSLLEEYDVTDVDVCGIATDYCVKATVVDARKAGFGARCLLDLTAWVSWHTTITALSDMRTVGAEIVHSQLS